MRSPRDLPRETSRLRVTALLLVLLAVGGARAADDGATRPLAPPLAPPLAAPLATSADDVASAVARTRDDPNLGGPQTERRLRFKPGDKPGKPEAAPPWLMDLLRWLPEAGRGVMWLLGAIGVALLIVFAWRWARVRADAVAGRGPLVLPSHVNDLDIRPDSLPDDIGASAHAQWQRGERRAALSLLYRGALSRLVHEHAVPIAGASTEGECLGLAQRALPAAPAAYFARLVDAWQTAVYAARWPESAEVLALCDTFDAQLPRRAAAPAADTLAPAGAGGAA